MSEDVLVRGMGAAAGRRQPPLLPSLLQCGGGGGGGGRGEARAGLGGHEAHRVVASGDRSTQMTLFFIWGLWRPGRAATGGRSSQFRNCCKICFKEGDPDGVKKPPRGALGTSSGQPLGGRERTCHPPLWKQSLYFQGAPAASGPPYVIEFINNLSGDQDWPCEATRGARMAFSGLPLGGRAHACHTPLRVQSLYFSERSRRPGAAIYIRRF